MSELAELKKLLNWVYARESSCRDLKEQALKAQDVTTAVAQGSTCFAWERMAGRLESSIERLEGDK